MHFIQLATNYYNQAALVAAGEKAEVLWLRAKAYCGDQENDGFIPREMLPRLTPTQATQRANALVKVGEWETVPGGWRFTNWDQITSTELAEKREAANRRQRKSRSTRPRKSRAPSRPVSRVTDGVTHAEVTRQEVEVEVKAAACGSSTRELPPPLVILRGALEARKLHVRWDTLTDDQVAEIEQLIDRHGDATLVAASLRMYRPEKPIQFAQGWIGGWRQLRQPGDLAIVDAPACDLPGHTGTAHHCRECASERLEAGGGGRR